MSGLATSRVPLARPANVQGLATYIDGVPAPFDGSFWAGSITRALDLANVGFRRTCYQVATAGIAQTARQASVYNTARFSDHAPLTIEYEVGL